MTGEKGFRRGFLLEKPEKAKKRAPPKNTNVSSALLDIESTSRSVFEVQGTEICAAEAEPERPWKKDEESSLLLTAVKTTSRSPPCVNCLEFPEELSKAENATTTFAKPSVVREAVALVSPEPRPKWLLAEEPSRTDSSQVPENEPIISQDIEEEDDKDINEDLAKTLLLMKRSSDWRKIGSHFVQAHLQTAKKRTNVWDLIVDGDLNLPKSRLALCLVSHHGIDPIRAGLKDTRSKPARCRAMKCLTLIEYYLDQDGVEYDLVELLLPEIRCLVKSEKGRTYLAQQSMEVAIKLISAAAIVGTHDGDVATLLHNYISIVDELLCTQLDWFGDDIHWFTVEGARRWCKFVVSTYWRYVNETHRYRGKAIDWCRALQGTSAHNVQVSSFSATLLPSSEFPFDSFITSLRVSLEGNDLKYAGFLNGFLAWLGRKATRIQIDLNDKRDCIEDLLLELLKQTAHPVSLTAAL